MNFKIIQQAFNEVGGITMSVAVLYGVSFGPLLRTTPFQNPN